MAQRVYLETSVVSYLTALPSRDLVVAGHQEVTREWWLRRKRFELYVSEAVLQEASRGDAEAASRRTSALTGVPILSTAPQALELAQSLLKAAAFPAKLHWTLSMSRLQSYMGWIFSSLGIAHTSRTQQSDPKLKPLAGRPVSATGHLHAARTLGG